MKKIIVTFLTIIILSSAAPVYAASSASTTTPGVSEKLNAQINELKEKIASRVSELNLVEKRGIIGVVSDVSGNKITLTDIAGNTRFADVDEITKFSSSSNSTFGLSDISKGTKLSILGLYNKQSKRILARFISTTVDPTFLSGSISDLDNKNYFITITTADQKQIKIDDQTSTKLLTSDKDNNLNKYGFSKLNVGDRIMVIGYPDKKDASTIVGDRILVLPNLPTNPKIKITKSTPTTAVTNTPTPTDKKTNKATTTP